jgi:4-hydroxy-tetrahydrodipicolinate synthase
MTISGAFTALVTPFLDDGSIDYPGLARQLAWHESEGMDGVVVGGTNGEGPSLSAVEKRDLVRCAVQHAGKLRVIAGLGTCSITEAVWLSEQAKKAGALASLVLPPFYFRGASETGIRDWFFELLTASELPCILYNFPKMTGFTFSECVLDSLFARDNCVGIKDSSGDAQLLQLFLGVAKKHGKSAVVGDERLLLECLHGGGAGTISGLANSFPRLVSRLYSERSEVLQELVAEACGALKKHPQPAVHKFVLGLKGLPTGRLRLPLEEISTGAQLEVSQFVQDFGF